MWRNKETKNRSRKPLAVLFAGAAIFVWSTFFYIFPLYTRGLYWLLEKGFGDVRFVLDKPKFVSFGTFTMFIVTLFLVIPVFSKTVELWKE